jgi:uncharacterized membrane protein (UPF0127 family)
VNSLLSWGRGLTTETNLKRLRWIVPALLVGGLLAVIVRGANEPADPRLAPVISADRHPLPGFGETLITVRSAQGAVFSWCLLLAENAEQRARGLMQVTDASLGGYSGMLFRFESDIDNVANSFYMRNTPMPLSIAFLDGVGGVVSTADMTPCGDVAGCPLYHATGPYRSAIEVPFGQLSALGIGSGSTVTDQHATCG